MLNIEKTYIEKNMLHDMIGNAFDSLNQFKHEKDLFLHFSNHENLYVNEEAEYRTPTGVYFYPLKETWIKYKVTSRKKFDLYPVGSDRLYIHLVHLSGLQDVVKYDNLKHDINKLDKLYPDLNIPSEAMWLSRHEYSSFQMLWELTKFVAKKTKKSTYEVEWAKVFKKLGYSGFVDRSGKGLIHGNEPYQAVVFDLKDIDLVKSIKNT